MPRVSIVIPTCIRPDKLRECLRSIWEWTDMSQTEVIVVGNGAPPETRGICAHYGVTLLWFDELLGYPKAVNHGIRAATGEFVVLLNDDTVLLPQPPNQWIEIMLRPMLQDGGVGVTGPLEAFDENSGHNFLIFFCVMVRKRCFDEVGLLDEKFLYFGEDTAFCIEAEKKRWKVIRVPEEYPTELVALDPTTTTLEAWKHDKIHSGQFGIFHDAESTIGRFSDSEEVLRESRKRLRELYGNEKMNTPTTNCERCGGPTLDGVCVGMEGKLNCDGLYLWRASVIDGWFGVDEMRFLASVVKNRGKIVDYGSPASS